MGRFTPTSHPFNSETVIEYELPQSGEIQLIVYDVTGQRVARLASGLREAGTYALRWDGRDDAGRQMASGCSCKKGTSEGSMLKIASNP